MASPRGGNREKGRLQEACFLRASWNPQKTFLVPQEGANMGPKIEVPGGVRAQLGVPGAISAPKGGPEASGRPFGRHFGPIVAPC